jgi:exodeoxyribonuclease VII large subunit
MTRRVEAAGAQLAARSGKLESLSPLAVLGRGYSLTSTVDDGQLVRNWQQASAGKLIRTRLAEGELTSRVESSEPSPAQEVTSNDIREE